MKIHLETGNHDVDSFVQSSSPFRGGIGKPPVGKRACWRKMLEGMNSDAASSQNPNPVTTGEGVGVHQSGAYGGHQLSVQQTGSELSMEHDQPIGSSSPSASIHPHRCETYQDHRQVHHTQTFQQFQDERQVHHHKTVQQTHLVTQLRPGVFVPKHVGSAVHHPRGEARKTHSSEGKGVSEAHDHRGERCKKP